MARLRTLKPGFFTNETLAELPPLARLAFAGLWVQADREGRLEDRPKRLKAEILPYDRCDFDQILAVLAAHAFIERYEVDGSRYIQVTNFSKHQNPHIKEAASMIPAPNCQGASTDPTPGEHSAETVLSVPSLGSGLPSSVSLSSVSLSSVLGARSSAAPQNGHDEHIGAELTDDEALSAALTGQATS
jgi:hypothetical protein